MIIIDTEAEEEVVLCPDHVIKAVIIAAGVTKKERGVTQAIVTRCSSSKIVV